MSTGKLYVVPLPLYAEATDSIPLHATALLPQMTYFVVENVRTARRYLRKQFPDFPIDNVQFEILDKHTPSSDLDHLLAPSLAGNDIALMSEAGCPGIADPGARLVHAAHQANIQVCPLVGPNSIVLALMASGMNGQQFQFNGYLSSKKDKLRSDLKKLETAAARGVTQIFIEAPYRNLQVIEQAKQVLHRNTTLCVAANLTAPTEFIYVQPISNWQQATLPNLHKIPAVFLIG